MFSLFTSEWKKARRNAENWLHLANKVFHYRKDVLTGAELHSLQSAIANLREDLSSRADASRLKLSTEQVEDALRRCGGGFYPKSFLAENVEMLLVAAILAIGVRTFFIQPFKIPTNSMWPTYYGMVQEVYQQVEEEPGTPAHVMRKLAFGVSRRDVDAPGGGEFVFPIMAVRDQYLPRIPFDVVPGRTWLVLPSREREYTFWIDDRPVSVRVPADFSIEPVIKDLFFADEESFEAAVSRRVRDGRTRPAPGNMLLIETGQTFMPGERVLSFDILTGDQLFVDRFSYNFRRPRVGESVVFRTNKIDGLRRPDGTPDEKYYIKRLVGKPGDVLEIRPPVLYRNGEPISNAEAFEKNARQEDGYPGYVAMGRLNNGDQVTVPEGMYFTLGDNSPASSDSREWGFVPIPEVVGTPVLIYYPFTKRWGRAK